MKIMTILYCNKPTFINFPLSQKRNDNLATDILDTDLIPNWKNMTDVAKKTWSRVLKKRKESVHLVAAFKRRLELSKKRNIFRHSKKMHVFTFFKECADDIDKTYLLKFISKWFYMRQCFFNIHFYKELKFFYVNKRRKVWKPKHVNLNYLWILTSKRIRRRYKKVTFKKFYIIHLKKFRRHFKGLSVKTLKRESSRVNKIYSSTFQNFMFRFERRLDVLSFRLHLFPSIKIAQYFVKSKYICVNQQSMRYKQIFLKYNQIFSVCFDFRLRMLMYLLNKIKKSRLLFSSWNINNLRQRSLIWYNFPVYLEVNWRILSCVIVQQSCIYMYKTVPFFAFIHPNMIFNHASN